MNDTKRPKLYLPLALLAATRNPHWNPSTTNSIRPNADALRRLVAAMVD